MENHKVNFTELVESLRWYEKEYKGSTMDEDDKKTFSLAADVLEDLLQTCAEWTAKYEEERDKNKESVPVVRCKDCKYRRESVAGLFHSGYYCDRCHFSYDMENCDDWFCADGERKDGAE